MKLLHLYSKSSILLIVSLHCYHSSAVRLSQQSRRAGSQLLCCCQRLVEQLSILFTCSYDHPSGAMTPRFCPVSLLSLGMLRQSSCWHEVVAEHTIQIDFVLLIHTRTAAVVSPRVVRLPRNTNVHRTVHKDQRCDGSSSSSNNSDDCNNNNLYLVAASCGESSVYRVERHRVHWENLVSLPMALEGVLVFLRFLHKASTGARTNTQDQPPIKKIKKKDKGRRKRKVTRNKNKKHKKNSTQKKGKN